MNYSKISVLNKVQEQHWPRHRSIAERTMFWDLVSGNSERLHFFQHDFTILDLHEYKASLTEAQKWSETIEDVITSKRVPQSLLATPRNNYKRF